MSGGSYDYLCHAWDLDDILAKRGELERMSARLAGLGWAEDAARETEELLVMLRQWQIRSEVRIARLRSVWKAVEWWDSCDWGEDQVRAIVEHFHGCPCDPSLSWSAEQDRWVVTCRAEAATP